MMRYILGVIVGLLVMPVQSATTDLLCNYYMGGALGTLSTKVRLDVPASTAWVEVKEGEAKASLDTTDTLYTAEVTLNKLRFKYRMHRRDGKFELYVTNLETGSMTNYEGSCSKFQGNRF